MASLLAEKPSEYFEEMSFVKRERETTPEAMDTNNNNNLSEGGSSERSEPAGRSHPGCEGSHSLQQPLTSAATGGLRNARHIGSTKHQQQGQGQTTAGSGRQTSAEFLGRRTSAEMLCCMDFPSQTGTPTSLSSQLMPSGLSLEGNEFATPTGSGRLSPQTMDRLTRKRALSISPLSSSSLDLNSLIRTSPSSLVNYITNSRGSSAGSFGHSPSLTLFNNVHQQPHSGHTRSMQVSLRNSNYPVVNAPSSAHTSSELEAHVKKEVDISHCSSVQAEMLTDMKMEDTLFDGCNIKMEPGIHDNSFLSPPPLIPMGTGLETVQEEPGGMFMSEEEELMHSDPSDYSAMLNSNECVFESKLGIIENGSDPERQKRVYYSYPSVEEPHNNQCKWEQCEVQCEHLDALVQHVNSDHIYRDSKKDFVCHWQGCVRLKKPFKAQYMLLVHMRRHTGEKPHKCTYKGCFKAYSRLENLKTHLRSHTGERPYVCKYEGCGKAFSNASDCAKHMNRTHSDEKPYACPNAGCTKRYTDPSSRRKHMKNCQINKKARQDNLDAMPGVDEESCADTMTSKTAPTTTAAATTTTPSSSSTSSSRKQKQKKSTQQKPTTSTNPGMKGGLSDYGYGSQGSQAGYISGNSQGYGSSQIGYTSSGYDENDYGGLQEDEISRILRDQRLSDPTELSGGVAGSNGGHMTSVRGGHNPATSHGQMMSQRYHFQSPPFQQSPLSPSQHFMAPPPPSLVPTSSARHLLPGEMTNPNNAHHNGVDYASRSRLNRTPSSGYSSFRKSPDDIDTASVISSSIRSSNSSRVSTPCSSGDHPILFPANQMPEGTAYPHQKHSLRVSNSYPQQQQGAPQHHHAHSHSDDIASTCSSGSRAWTYSSQSSRYSSYSGNELSDDILENLPTPHSRKNSFSKSEPLPLPESMQHNFSGMGMEYGNGEHGMEFSQHGFVDQSSSTMPLRHYDHSGSLSSQQSSHSRVFSQESGPLSGGGGERYETYINMVQHMSSPGNSMVSPGNNMVMGNMETFTQALSEETQYYQSLVYQGQVSK